MVKKDNPIKQLIRSLSKLPGIGEKTATRLALHIMNMPENSAIELSESIKEAREKICLCTECFNYSDGPLCFVCADPSRLATSLRKTLGTGLQWLLAAGSH